MNREDFIYGMFSPKAKENAGINAMSVSDISGIPRATVIRKLNKLVKNNFLKIDEKKHYKIKEVHLKKTIPIHKDVIDKLADFSELVYNVMIFNADKKNTDK